MKKNTTTATANSTAAATAAAATMTIGQIVTAALVTDKRPAVTIGTIDGVSTVVTVDGTTLAVVTLGKDNKYSVKEYAIPTGDRVTDSVGMLESIGKCLDGMEVARVRRVLSRYTDKQLDGTATAADDANAAAVTAWRDSYLSDVKLDKPDAFTAAVVFAMTGTKDITFSAAATIGKLLRADNAAKNDITSAVNEILDTRPCGWHKQTKARLNDADVENLRCIAVAVTRKWSKSGIIGRVAKDSDLLRQVLLTVLEEEFSLKVTKKGKTNDTLWSF